MSSDMPAPATTRERVLAALAEAGEPMTLAEIREAIGEPRVHIKALDSSVRLAHQRGLLRRAGWHRNIGNRGAPSPKWAIADGRPDVPPLRLDPVEVRREITRRYHERHRAVRALKDRTRRGQEITPLTMLLYVPGPRRIARGMT